MLQGMGTGMKKCMMVMAGVFLLVLIWYVVSEVIPEGEEPEGILVEEMIEWIPA